MPNQIFGSIPGLTPASFAEWEDFGEFKKAAATSTYETDHAQLAGMSALRPTSIESQMRAIVATNDTFTLFKELKRQSVDSAVHEIMIQVARGGQAGGMNLSELGQLQFEVGDYVRQIDRSKIFATAYMVSDFANAQKTIPGPHPLTALEEQNAMVRIANAIEVALFESNEAYSPNKINGYKTKVRNWKNGKNLIDFAGESDINELIALIFGIKAQVRQVGSFGDVDNIFVDAYTQNQLDQHLFPQYRVSLNDNPSNLQYGAPVSAIRSSYGLLNIKHTIWNNNNDNTVPTIVRTAGKLPDKPTEKPTVTATPAAAGVAGGAAGWTADRIGQFYYKVALVDADGREGPLSDAVSATVALGGGIEIAGTATQSGASVATGGKVYRSKRNPTAAPEDKEYRLCGEFAVDPTTNAFSYTDVNQIIPGSGSIPVMHLIPEAIQWLQLKPTTRIPLYQTNMLAHTAAVACYGTLQIGYPQHQFLIENYLSPHAPWQPFK